jgi:hypothetical protein
MKSLEMKSVLENLNTVLGGRFGVAVHYLSLGDITKVPCAPLETAKRNAGAPMIVGHNQLIVPIRMEGSLVGATWVDEINGLNPKELSEVKATIDLLVQEAVKISLSADLLESDTASTVSAASAASTDQKSLGFNILPFERLAHA